MPKNKKKGGRNAKDEEWDDGDTKGDSKPNVAEQDENAQTQTQAKKGQCLSLRSFRSLD